MHSKYRSIEMTTEEKLRAVYAQEKYAALKTSIRKITGGRPLGSLLSNNNPNKNIMTRKEIAKMLGLEEYNISDVKENEQLLILSFRIISGSIMIRRLIREFE